MIQIDSSKFLEMVALGEASAALQYVTNEVNRQIADMDKYIDEKEKANEIDSGK